jgi:hypothetical protein
MEIFFVLMEIGNFDLLGVGAGPAEANAPLVIDSNGMLSAATSLQSLQMITRRQLEECQLDGSIDELQLDKAALPNVARQPAGTPCDPKFLSVTVGKTLDHAQTMAKSIYSSSRYYSFHR